MSNPDGLAPGAYYLIAGANDPGTVTEITTTNNCTATGTLVAVGPVKFPGP